MEFGTRAQHEYGIWHICRRGILDQKYHIRPEIPSRARIHYESVMMVQNCIVASYYQAVMAEIISAMVSKYQSCVCIQLGGEPCK